MIRRTLLTTLLALGTAAVAWGARPATFVLTNGQRVSGELTYKGGTAYTLNGKDYPSTEVAIIAFVPGDPNAAELNQLPTTDNPSDEHQRHLFVTSDGQVIPGKLYDFSPDGETVRFDPVGATSAADRRTMPTSQLSRVYITPSAARQVYASVLNNPNTAVATSGVSANGTVTVAANQPWTDTGITVKKGDRLSFHTNGQIRVASGSGAEANASPDGAGNFQGARNRYPVPQMPVGGLIARVDTGQAFPIGSNSQPITMPANGRLYLGINDDEFGDNSGAFTVVINR